VRHERTRREGGEHDSGYKLLFSHRRMMESLCRGFLPELGSGCLDFATLERRASSFVSESFRERHSDLVWRLDRGSRSLYLLLEFQSTPDPLMPLRLLTYVSLLLEDLIRQGRYKPGDELPVILVIVLYTGTAPWRAPLDVADLFGVLPPELLCHVPALRYVLLDAKRLDLGRADLAENLAAAVLRIDTCDSPGDFPSLVRRVLELATRQGDPRLRSSIKAWLRRKLRKGSFGGIIIPELEDATMLEESIVRWEQEFLVAGMRRMLLSQLHQRFGRVPASIRQTLETIQSERELKRLGRRVLVARSLAELGLR
jgi:hypothetical protein